MGKKYYPQTLLVECKYKLTKKKIEDLITNDFDSSSESDSKSDAKNASLDIAIMSLDPYAYFSLK